MGCYESSLPDLKTRAKEDLAPKLKDEEFHGARVAPHRTQPHLWVALQRVRDKFDAVYGDDYKSLEAAWGALMELHGDDERLWAFLDKAFFQYLAKERASVKAKYMAQLGNDITSTTAADPQVLTKSMDAMSLWSVADLEKQHQDLDAEEAAYKKWQQKRKPQKSPNQIRRKEILASMSCSAAQGGDTSVEQDCANLLAQVPGQARGSSFMAMRNDGNSSKQHGLTAGEGSDDEDSDGPGDGGGFD